MKQDYEKQQVDEQRETNAILYINTIFTVVTGLATIILSIFAFLK